MGDQISHDELTRQIQKAMEAGRLEPHAVWAYYQPKSNRVVVDLDSGITIMFPVALAEGLAEVDPDILATVRVTPGGMAIRWESLDIDLSVSGLLAGLFGSKSWMSRVYATLGEKGGSQKTPAKVRAARENGRLGGRPRKKVG